MSRRADARAFALAVLVSPVLSCGSKPAPPPAPDAAEAPLAKTATIDAGLDASPPRAVSGPPAFAWAFDCAETSAPRNGRSVGHTSVVAKLELANGTKAAWKPDARKVRGRYRGEIAAYRLAIALGLPNVPPACARAFTIAEAQAAFAASPDAARTLADDLVAEPDGVHGALIPWIAGLRFWPLEKEPLRTEVRGWLSGADIPEGKRELARDASNLVVFDFLTGNWDRYSGANVGLDASGTRVLFIDNDAAFMERPPAEELARSEARLKSTLRFSRSLIQAVRALDPDGLRRALGEEGGRPLVPDAVVSAVAERARQLVGIVDGHMRMRGKAETLFFP